MAETSTCYSFSCRTTVDGSVAICPKCGTRMRTPRDVRRLGWFLLLLGLFLVGFMGVLALEMAPMLLRPGEQVDGGSFFTGTAAQAGMIFWMFAAVIVFGLGTMVNGAVQIATGQRNRIVTTITLVLAAALLI